MKKIAWLLVAALLMQSVPINVMANDVEPQNVGEEVDVEEVTEEMDDAAVEDVSKVLVEEAANDTTFADDMVITSEHIPDETLMKYVREKTGKAEGEDITYADLQGILYFEANYEDLKAKGWEPIKSIEGMQYMKRLYRVYLKGNQITDASPLKDLTEINWLYLDGNKLTSLPDFSAWEKCTTLSIKYNRIPEEQILANYPDTLKDKASNAVKMQCYTENVLTEAETFHVMYDKNGNAHFPIIANAECLNPERTHVVQSVRVNGTDITNSASTKLITYEDPIELEVKADLASVWKEGTEEYLLEVDVKDEFDEVVTVTGKVKVLGMQKSYENTSESTPLISPTSLIEKGLELDIVSFATTSNDIYVSEIALLNENGDVVLTKGLSDTGVDVSYNNDIRFTNTYMVWDLINIFGNSSDICATGIAYETLEFTETLKDGVYDIRYTLSDGTTYTTKGIMEVESDPVVYGVYDSAKWNDPIYVDQTSDYVSLYVYGLNLKRDMVTPVFYDESSSVATGDILATETAETGLHVRMEKEESAQWDDLPNGRQDFKVELETADGIEVRDLRQKDQTSIYKDEIYYREYDNVRNKITFWMADYLDASTGSAPTLTIPLKSGSVESQIVKEGVFVKEKNALTNQMETKAVFDFSEDEYNKVRKANYLKLILTYTNKAGELVEIYDSSENYSSAPKVYFRNHSEEMVARNKTIFYLPYWVGGVYQIDAFERGNGYLTAEDAKALNNQLYATSFYGKDELVTLEHGNFLEREVSYLDFWKETEFPEAPKGKPSLTISNGTYERIILNWTAVEGADLYEVWATPGAGYEDCKFRYGSTSGLSYTLSRNGIIDIVANQFGIESLESIELYVVPVVSKGSVQTRGEESNHIVFDGSAVCEHKWKKTVTKKASFTADGEMNCICSECKETKTEVLPKVKVPTLSYSLYTYDGKVKAPIVTVKDTEGNKLVKGTDYTVVYGTGRKNVGSYSVKVTLKGNYTGVKTVYFRIQPKAVTKAKAVLYGYDDIKVSWAKTTGAVGYRVYYKLSTAKNYTKYKTTTSANTTLANLSDGVTYNIKVVPYYKVSGKIVESTKYTTVSATTLKKVTKLTVVKSGTKVKVSWANIAGESGYQISRSTKKAGTSIVSTYPTTTGTSRTITAKKGVAYYYKVRAYKTVNGKKIYGQWSAVIKYTLK